MPVPVPVLVEPVEELVLYGLVVFMFAFDEFMFEFDELVVVEVELLL